jgi:hypothetical protein
MKYTIPIISLLFSLSSAQIAGEPSHLEPGLSGRSDIVFYGGFETDIPGVGDWRNIWGSSWGTPNRPVTTVNNAQAFIGSKTLRVDYPQGGVGPGETGTQWPTVLANFSGTPTTYEELYLRYYVYFEPGFDFNKGGKLPGLMGGGDSHSRSGGNQPDGTNGWTMRFMWRTGGQAVVYAYLPPGTYQGGQWGNDLVLNNKSFVTGQWHCIEQYIKVNTIGTDDGIIRVWFDNDLALELTDVTYRTIENDHGRVGGFYFSTFHGGSTVDWAPSVNSYAQFDGFVLAHNRVGLFSNTPTSLRKTELNTNSLNQTTRLIADPEHGVLILNPQYGNFRLNGQLQTTH